MRGHSLKAIAIGNNTNTTSVLPPRKSYPTFKPYSKVSCSHKMFSCFSGAIAISAIPVTGTQLNILPSHLSEKMLRSSVQIYSRSFHGSMLCFSPFCYEVLKIPNSVSLRGSIGKQQKRARAPSGNQSHSNGFCRNKIISMEQVHKSMRNVTHKNV